MNDSTFGVRICVLADGQRIPLLVDRLTNLPLDLATRFTLARRWMAGDSLSTAREELRAVAYFLEWARRHGIDLDQRFGPGTFFTNQEIVSLCDALRESQRPDRPAGNNVVWVGLSHASKKLAKKSRNRPVVQNNVWYQRIKYVEGYIQWLMDDVISRLPSHDPRFDRIRTRRKEVVDALEKQLPDTKDNGREGLSPELRARFLEIIHPDSPENPFQASLRFRNYVMLRLYFDVGCRLSEALVLYTTDYGPDSKKPTLSIRRRPNNPLDPRADIPLVKTQERIIALTGELAGLIEGYIVRDRSKLPGAKKSPFLFLTRDGQPIARRTVEDLPLVICRSHPEFAGCLSTHVLRHDWNDRFSDLADEHGWSDEKETRHRNYLQGWTKTSKQGLHYTRRSSREEANRAAMKLQKKDWSKSDDD
jgi:integrase